MAYRDCMDFPRGRPFDNLLLDKAFDIAKISKYDMNKNILYEYFMWILYEYLKNEYQRSLTSINFSIRTLLVLILQMVVLKMRICHTKN